MTLLELQDVLGKAIVSIEDEFLRESLDNCQTMYDLTEKFNAKFPQHTTTYGNLQKRLSKLGLKKELTTFVKRKYTTETLLEL